MNDQEFYERLRDVWMALADHCVDAINSCRADYAKVDRQGWEGILARCSRRAQIYHRKAHGGESIVSAEVTEAGERQAEITRLRTKTHPDQPTTASG